MNQMNGDEKTMLDKHEKQIEEDILPRLGKVEQTQQAYNNQLEAFKLQLGEFKLSQKELKNNQQDLKNTVIQYGQRQADTLDKVLVHSLGIKEKQDEIKGNLEAAQITLEATHITAEKDTKIAKFSTKEKIIVGVVTALFGTGGIAGLIAVYLQLKGGA